VSNLRRLLSGKAEDTYIIKIWCFEIKWSNVSRDCCGTRAEAVRTDVLLKWNETFGGDGAIGDLTYRGREGREGELACTISRVSYFLYFHYYGWRISTAFRRRTSVACMCVDLRNSAPNLFKPDSWFQRTCQPAYLTLIISDLFCEACLKPAVKCDHMQFQAILEFFFNRFVPRGSLKNINLRE